MKIRKLSTSMASIFLGLSFTVGTSGAATAAPGKDLSVAAPGVTVAASEKYRPLPPKCRKTESGDCIILYSTPTTA